MIEIKFDASSVDTVKGLYAYMNTMIISNEDLTKFELRKVTYFWGHREDNYIYYMLAPPWVHLRIVRMMIISRMTWSMLSSLII
jgi:hypothetical protein